MTLQANSTWRCRCGAEQTAPPMIYADALRGLRGHQADEGCMARRHGTGDRIHSKPPAHVSEARKVADEVSVVALHGPPRPPAARIRRGREGLPWLPGN